MQTFEELGVEFQILLNQTLSKIDGLSSKSMRRILKKTLAHPLEDDLIKLQEKSKDEVNVYDSALELQSIKFSMMVESLKRDAEEERIKESKLERESRKINDVSEKSGIPDFNKGIDEINK